MPKTHTSAAALFGRRIRMSYAAVLLLSFVRSAASHAHRGSDGKRAAGGKLAQPAQLAQVLRRFVPKDAATPTSKTPD